MITALKMVAVLVGAMLLGNMFMGELHKVRRQGLPLYKAYLTPPGIVIVLAILLPLFLWLFRQIG